MDSIVKNGEAQEKCAFLIKDSIFWCFIDPISSMYVAGYRIGTLVEKGLIAPAQVNVRLQL